MQEKMKEIALKKEENDEEEEVHYNFKVPKLFPETPKKIGKKGIVGASKASADKQNPNKPKLKPNVVAAKKPEAISKQPAAKKADAPSGPIAAPVKNVAVPSIPVAASAQNISVSSRSVATPPHQAPISHV